MPHGQKNYPPAHLQPRLPRETRLSAAPQPAAALTYPVSELISWRGAGGEAGKGTYRVIQAMLVSGQQDLYCNSE